MRITLALLLAVSGYLVGCGIARGQGDECDALKDVIRLCEYMEYRFKYSSKPLSEVLSESGTRFGSAAAAEGWERATDTLPLNADCIREMKTFSRTLGNVGLETQLKSLAALKIFLEKQASDLQSSLLPRQKSTKAFCGLIGALAGLLLI